MNYFALLHQMQVTALFFWSCTVLYSGLIVSVTHIHCNYREDTHFLISKGSFAQIMQVIFIIKQKDKWEYFLLILFQTCKHLMVDLKKTSFFGI